mgnify:CR=1 FL=1
MIGSRFAPLRAFPLSPMLKTHFSVSAAAATRTDEGRGACCPSGEARRRLRRCWPSFGEDETAATAIDDAELRLGLVAAADRALLLVLLLLDDAIDEADPPRAEIGRRIRKRAEESGRERDRGERKKSGLFDFRKKLEREKKSETFASLLLLLLLRAPSSSRRCSARRTRRQRSFGDLSPSCLSHQRDLERGRERERETKAPAFLPSCRSTRAKNLKILFFKKCPFKPPAAPPERGSPSRSRP